MHRPAQTLQSELARINMYRVRSMEYILWTKAMLHGTMAIAHPRQSDGWKGGKRYSELEEIALSAH